MASEPPADQDLPAEPPVTLAARGRAQTIQRLQIGLTGLAAMVLLVSLANIIRDQTREAEQGAVGEDPAALGPDAAATPAQDPLADAGVVPDIPASPTPAATSAANAPAAQP